MDGSRSFSTGAPEVDAALDRALAALATALPGRVLGVYLFGSYAEGSAVPTSDLDLFVVLRGAATPGEAERARNAVTTAIDDGPPLPDVLVLEEDALRRAGHFRLETASVLLAGDDIRGRLPPTTPALWLRRYGRAPVDYMDGVLRRADRLTFPLDYPDSDGAFFGYDARTLPHGGPAHNVKALVATVCWIASVLAAMESGRLARTKAEGVAFYRADVGDAWAGFVADVYGWGKERWSYLVPAGPAERTRLRALCAGTLAFENHYLTRYRDYLLEQARGTDRAGRLLAAELLGRRIRYPGDPTIRAVLVDLAASGDDEVAAAARGV